MSAPVPDARSLAQALWAAPLSDPQAPGRNLLGAVSAGASYGEVKRALTGLHRLQLPAYAAAQRAQHRWPNSIDMARLALDFSPDAVQAEALETLAACVERANRRRAVLADACQQLGRHGQGWTALTEIDPSSPTAVADMHRRVEWSVGMGEFATAGRDLDWLEGQSEPSQIAAQRIWLCYRRDGAAAVAQQMAQATTTAARVWATFHEIFLNESDHAGAREALARWQSCPDAQDWAIARAVTRQTLERGDGLAAREQLCARLDLQTPWLWESADHVQWLRAGQLCQVPAEELLVHAVAACRVHPRHDWLHHLQVLLREGVEDWRGIAPRTIQPAPTPERVLSSGRAALRQGLSGQAARRVVPALQMAKGTAMGARLWSLRAEALSLAGRVRAALHAQTRAMSCARDAVQVADCALQLADIHLLQGDATQAERVLEPVTTAFPDRLGLLLTQARIAFFAGDFAKAQRLHTRFNMLKAHQTGQFTDTDVRDRIVADAVTAVQGITPAFARDTPVQVSVAEAGADRVTGSAGLSACLLLRELRDGGLPFTADPTARIPRVMAHYWQGPQGPALPRALARWSALHPDYEGHLFDAERAADWLRDAFGTTMAARFHALEQPALRADLFRLCWMVATGGIFADLDEYPRIPVTPWLTGARAVLCIERGFGTIANNFIAAEPGHPICTRALDNALQALGQTDAPYAWWHTGPAQWTRAAFACRLESTTGQSVRYLSQADYCRRVATNLPYPHKRSPDHWR